MTCIQKCIICYNPNNLLDSKFCLAYIELSTLIKYAANHDTTIKEARFKIRKPYSAITNRPNNAIAQLETPQDELNHLKVDIHHLKDELKSLKGDTIKLISKNKSKNCPPTLKH